MRRCVIIFVIAGFVSCKKDTGKIGNSTTNATTNPQGGGSSGATNTGSGFSTTADLDSAMLLKLVNNIRASGCNCGTTAMPPVAALKWNNILTIAAAGHSKDMNSTGDFSHNSSDGTSFSQRISNAGYKWTALGENIASGQTSVQQVFDSWMSSEDHCKNIMSASFIEMGAARAGNYWTQDFGHP